ncbi:MAG TPA: DUF1345 domain-containing protein, partial [Sphingomicrobium sp.]|nr:DUF1345 domain-containing protein [Sphingomicrobium sp.]
MANRRGIGNIIAPPRFLAFLATLIIAFPLALNLIPRWALAAMMAFDAAAILFLVLCAPLFGTRDAKIVKDHAQANDANRVLLLILTGIVIAILLTAISAEVVGHSPQPVTRSLVIVTLALAWLFSNTVYAFHYAHLFYSNKGEDRAGLKFPETLNPVYWDFIYFSFTCGMAFA